jgi:tetratricopeptide (TPR) repeat protein
MIVGDSSRAVLAHYRLLKVLKKHQGDDDNNDNRADCRVHFKDDACLMHALALMDALMNIGECLYQLGDFQLETKNGKKGALWFHELTWSMWIRVSKIRGSADLITSRIVAGHIGACYMNIGNYNEALVNFRNACQHDWTTESFDVEDVYPGRESLKWWDFVLRGAVFQRNMAMCHLKQKEFNEAKSAFKEVIRMLTRRIPESVLKRVLVIKLPAEGFVQLLEDRCQEAVNSFREALVEVDKIHGDRPHQDLAEIHTYLGIAYYCAGSSTGQSLR